MGRARIKKDDVVVAISGASKGQRGKVLKVDHDKGRVTIEGVNVRKRHMRRTQLNPQGGIEEREMPIHISNVMPSDEYDKRHQDKAAPSGEAEEKVEKQDKGDE